LGLLETLKPPLDERGLLGAVPELSLSRGIGQSPYHHPDTFEHALEVGRDVERELEENSLGPASGESAAKGSASSLLLTTSPSP
jgi:hypothetical protein